VKNDGTHRGWKNLRECVLGFHRRESDERRRRGYGGMQEDRGG